MKKILLLGLLLPWLALQAVEGAVPADEADSLTFYEQDDMADFRAGLVGNRNYAYASQNVFEKILHNQFFFRGDSRNPETIYTEGFRQREKSTQLSYRIPYHDICGYSGICFSPHFDVAALFPQLTQGESEPDPITHVYLIRPKKFFPTWKVQYLAAAEGISSLCSDSVEKAFNNLYAREYAALQVLPEEIIGCVKIQRAWAGANHTMGGSYAVLSNPHSIRNNYPFNVTNFENSLSGVLATPLLNYPPRCLRSNAITSTVGLFGNDNDNEENLWQNELMLSGYENDVGDYIQEPETGVLGVTEPSVVVRTPEPVNRNTMIVRYDHFRNPYTGMTRNHQKSPERLMRDFYTGLTRR